MPEAIAQLCRIIAQKLQTQPEISQAELMQYVKAAIAADLELQAALQVNPQMLQLNRENSKGLQTIVEQGGIANIGDHYHLSDPEKFQAALLGVVEKLQKSYQPLGIAKNLGDRERTKINPTSIILDDTPPSTDSWQGRIEECAQIQQWIVSKTPRLIGITGAGGYGKSALAAKIYSEAQEFQHKLWVSFNQPYSFNQWGRTLLERLDIQLDVEASTEAMSMVLIRHLSKERCLLVLDNLETLLADALRWQPYQQFLQKWLSRDTQSTILVTSQERLKLTLRATEWLPLAGLTSDAGVALLQSLAVQGTRDDLQEMVRLADGHPLLLQLTVEWLRQERGAAASVGYVLNQSDLNLLTDIVGEHRDNPGISVGRVLEQMMERLEPRLKMLWLNLSVYRQSFSEAQAKAILPDAAIADLRLLARRSLLQEQPTQNFWQFSFLPLLKTFAQQQASDQLIAHERAIEYYRSVTKPGPWQTLEDIAAHLELFYHLCEIGQYEHAFDVIHSCVEFLGQGYYLIMVRCYERLVQDGATSLQQNKWKLGASFHALASAYQSLENFHGALYCHEQALDIARDIGHYQGEACALIGLGNTCGALGSYSHAIELFEQSLKVAQEQSDLCSEAIALANLGRAYSDIQRYPEAIDYYQQSLQCARQAGYRQSEANTLRSLGGICEAVGQYLQAIEYYQQSLVIKQQLGNSRDETIALNTLGVTYCCIGEYEEAVECHLQALKIDQQMGYLPHEAASLINLSNAYLALKQAEQAEECYQRSLVIAQYTGSLPGEAQALISLGHALGLLGKLSEKITAYQRAREICQLIQWEALGQQCDAVLQELERR